MYYYRNSVKLQLAVVLAVQLFIFDTLQAESFDHGAWDRLLQEHIYVIDAGKSTQVDYAALKIKRSELKQYLASMAAVARKEFDSWEKDDQLAFLINAYNSWTIELILTKYPDLYSIKDLGSFFTSPWEKKIVELFGEKHSLDDIEHGFIRGSGRYNDPRIHFAVNCASIGCPALKPEAYRGDTLDSQLEEASIFFLQDKSRNRFYGGVLEVSSIFKWYKEDFQKGWLGIESLSMFFVRYFKEIGLTMEQKESLAQGKIKIEYLDYDWKLNDKAK